MSLRQLRTPQLGAAHALAVRGATLCFLQSHEVRRGLYNVMHRLRRMDDRCVEVRSRSGHIALLDQTLSIHLLQDPSSYFGPCYCKYCRLCPCTLRLDHEGALSNLSRCFRAAPYKFLMLLLVLRV
jgi:hypothetical protein